MANWQLNTMVKSRQLRTLIMVGSGVLLILAIMIVLLIDGRPKKTPSIQKPVDITGIVDESFTEAAADNALTAQQSELESLKKQISELTLTMKKMGEDHEKQLSTQKEELTAQISTMVLANQEKSSASEKVPNTSNELKEV
ncbi:conjugal transfer protein TraB, partial [Legionella qingyii]